MSESSHERYLRGEPLNPELAAVRDGRPIPQEVPELAEKEEPLEDIERELTKKERMALQKFRKSPEYEVVQRIYKKAFHIHRKRAISISEFGTRAEDAERLIEWDLLRMYRRVGLEIFALIDAEILQLQPKKEAEKKKP